MFSGNEKARILCKYTDTNNINETTRCVITDICKRAPTNATIFR